MREETTALQDDDKLQLPRLPEAQFRVVVEKGVVLPETAPAFLDEEDDVAMLHFSHFVTPATQI